MHDSASFPFIEDGTFYILSSICLTCSFLQEGQTNYTILQLTKL